MNQTSQQSKSQDVGQAQLSREDISKMIIEGRRLIVSGDLDFLKSLPKGNWIGGTTQYTMSSTGGSSRTDVGYIQEIPKAVSEIKISKYDAKSIESIYKDSFDNGFSFAIIPIFSDVLRYFARNVRSFPDFAVRPLIGWVSGMPLEELGKVPAWVVDGSDGKMYPDFAIVMHCRLPAEKYGDISIVNIFEADLAGDLLTFDVDDLNVRDVWVNGKQMLFAQYLKENNVDTRWPLVGDYFGTYINSSFAGVDDESQMVKLLAPVFKGVSYRLSRGLASYEQYLEAFRKSARALPTSFGALTCNCVLNYKYGELEGKRLNELDGPFVFGEIAYQLLNQTLVRLSIHDVT